MQSTAFLCVICAICGRITRKSTQSIYTKKPQCLSLIPLMIADETQNNTNYKKYFSANKCSLLHSSLRDLRYQRENNTQEYSINPHK